MEYMTCKEVIELLGINMNNLRQLQYRKTLVWEKKEGRVVFYDAEKIRQYKEIRDKRLGKVSE